MKEDRRKTKSPTSKKASSAPKRDRRKPAETARKGKLVEAVVAMLHDMPGVKVERNVLLPPVHGDQTRKREIDVLLTATVAGYPVRIAFSCKNESKKIEPGKIDEFIGELDDVGIPPQHGIFVCVNGYTRGASTMVRTCRGMPAACARRNRRLCTKPAGVLARPAHPRSVAVGLS